MKERASACMKPIEGTMAHDCWTVAFGRSNLEGQVVSTNLSKRRGEEIIIIASARGCLSILVTILSMSSDLNLYLVCLS